MNTDKGGAAQVEAEGQSKKPLGLLRWSSPQCAHALSIQSKNQERMSKYKHLNTSPSIATRNRLLHPSNRTRFLIFHPLRRAKAFDEETAKKGLANFEQR